MVSLFTFLEMSASISTFYLFNNWWNSELS